jgi:class 3 adenylate cyclase
MTEASSPSPLTTELVVRGPGIDEARFAVDGRMHVGRTCPGVDEAHRLLLPGEGISRDHCHVVLDPGTASAVLVDTSTNGTRVNGVQVERSSSVMLGDGDRIGIGPYELEFSSAIYRRSTPAGGASATVRLIAQTRMSVVCGDLVDYTGLAAAAGGTALFEAMHSIFDELRIVLTEHRGTLYDYVGDALLAVWEHDIFPDAVRRAVAFARAADARVREITPGLPLRRPDGSPLSMGWAVNAGELASSVYTGSLQGLVGDAVNIGFRLASLAGRDGRASILVAEDAYAELGDEPGAPEPVALAVKGREAPVMVWALR